MAHLTSPPSPIIPPPIHLIHSSHPPPLASLSLTFHLKIGVADRPNNPMPNNIPPLGDDVGGMGIGVNPAASNGTGAAVARGVGGDHTQPLSTLDLLNNSPNMSIPPPLLIPIPNPNHQEPPLSVLNQKINSCYYDLNTFSSTFSNTNKPIIASINIQSLQSKHASLSQLIHDCHSSNIPLSIIALQETWQIQHPDLVSITGFNFIHTQRTANRGGGVGFYIRDDIDFKVNKTLSTFIPFSFECLTIEIVLKNKRTSVSSIYRSPNPPPLTSLSTHHDNFNTNLENLLHQLSPLFHDSYILLDSNINILPSIIPHQTELYLNTVNSNGFTQTIHKATRSQNTHHSLIDHILTNSLAETLTSGTVILDIRDHFLTFIQLPNSNPHIPTKN